LEDSLAVSYKPIQTFTICSSDYASWYLPQGIEGLHPYKLHVDKRGRVKEGSWRWIWLTYSQYKNEYRIFQPVENIIRRGQGRKKINRGDEPFQFVIHTYMEMLQGYFLCR
jgi:hypothetical protein